MSYAVMPLEDYKNTCDTIREKTNDTEVIKSGELAEKVDKVYNAGKKAEYDAFWDNFQYYGNRTYYAYAFGGQTQNTGCWNENNFKPKYDITPISSANAADGMFQYSQMTDIASLLSKAGVKLDTSNSTKLTAMFDRSTVTKAPPLDLSSCTALTNVFYSCSSLTDAEFNNIQEDCTFNKVFYYCSALKNLTITGTIGQNGLDLTRSTKLTHDSLMNVINCLKDYKDSGTTYTLTLGSTNLKKLTDTEKAIATQKGWTLA